MKRFCRARHALVATLVMMAAACSDNLGPQLQIPAALQVGTTSVLQGRPGFVVSDDVSVRLVDRSGDGVAGYTVDFAAINGGQVSPASVTTDAQGYARAQWTLGSTEGEQQLRAVVRDLDLSGLIRAMASWGRERGLALVSQAQLGTVIGACAVPQAVIVRVTDASGAPVPDAPVTFTASAAGTLDPAVGRSDAQGLARTMWTPGTSAGTQNVTVSLQVPSAPKAVVSASVLPRARNGFAAIGNTLIGPDCKPYIIRGITRPSLEWEPFGDPNFGNVATDFANMRAWGANTVRLPVNQTFWVSTSSDYVPGYRDLVISTVGKARAAGLNVIFDLHIGDRGESNYADTLGMPQMPDVKHSLPFWKDVARTFKDDGGVIFEMYNEPHDIDWAMWRNGGMIPTGPTYAGGPIGQAYEAVGMQQLYNAIRAEGAENLVIAAGLHWGYFLDGVVANALTGYNIAYSAHPYDWPDKQPETWEAAWGSLADTHPVVVTEFGAYDCTRTDFYRAFLDYAERKNIGWVAWAWWTPPAVSSTYTAEQRAAQICRFPSLITDWNGTPSTSGAVVKERLLRAAGG